LDIPERHCQAIPDPHELKAVYDALKRSHKAGL
jgi:hypothetical protein